METTRQQLLHSKLRTLRNTRTGETHRKAAAMAAEMDVDPMAMLDTLGLTPEEKAAVERAAATGSQADVQRALIKTQSKALGLGAASQEAAGTARVVVGVVVQHHAIVVDAVRVVRRHVNFRLFARCDPRVPAKGLPLTVFALAVQRPGPFEFSFVADGHRGRFAAAAN